MHPCRLWTAGALILSNGPMGGFSVRLTRRRAGRLIAGATAAPFVSRLATAAADHRIDRNVMVPMRDGVRLATDIHRPGASGRYPVILERTPYDKSAPSRSERTAEVEQPRSRAEVAAPFVQAGYAVVYQDCRGRYASEGGFTKYLSEAADGYDTVVWLIAQPWCNGRVGTMGLSYAAHTQAALGCLAPPGLAAQVLDCGGFSNAYQGGIRQGGAFELKQATWAWRNALADARDPAVKAALRKVDIKDWFARMPWSPGHSPVAAATDYESYLFEQWTHGEFDDYWKQAGLWTQGFYARYADVPMLHMSGWFDPYSATATDNYVGLSRAKRGPVRLIMGPWTHGDRSLTHAGDVDFGPAATLDHNIAEDFFVFRLRWFDRWLRGLHNGIDEEPPVRLFVMGGGSGRKTAAGRLDHGGRWRAAADWPLPETRYVRFYLHQDGSLSERTPDEAGAPRTFTYDPADPVPTHHVGRPRDGRRRLRPTRNAKCVRREAARSAACRAARRAGVSDTGTGRRPRGHRADRGAAVDRLVRARHRLHRQAHRCLSAERRLAGRFCDERHRRHPAHALPRFMGASGLDAAG
jgi:putative CocE/NonD family hydrolase